MELSSCIFLPLLTAMLTKINEYIKNSTNIHHVWLKKFYTSIYLTRITNSQLIDGKDEMAQNKIEHIRFYCLNYLKYNGMNLIEIFPFRSIWEYGVNIFFVPPRKYPRKETIILFYSFLCLSHSIIFQQPLHVKHYFNKVPTHNKN